MTRRHRRRGHQGGAAAPATPPTPQQMPPRRPDAAPPPCDPAPAPEVPAHAMGARVSPLGPKLPAGHPAQPTNGAEVVALGGGVWMEVMRPVTPEIATAMLRYNQDNRPVQQRLVDAYSRLMSTPASWVEEVSDPIRFASTGKLLDGQKRLMAVEKSGKTIRFTIVTGLPESAQDVVDTGQHRSVSDQLKINGYKNNMVVAAAARVLWLWDRGALLSGQPSPSNPELLDYVLELTGPTVSIESSGSIATGCSARRTIPTSVLAAAHYRMACVDPGAAAEFIEKLSTGANLTETSPILALRETSARRKESKQRTSQAEWVFLVARAWVLWRKGASTTRLQLPQGGLTMQKIPQIV